MGFTIVVSGIEDVQHMLDNLPDALDNAFGSGTLDFARELLDTQVIPITPVATGQLRDSAHVDGPDFSDNLVQVSIGFDASYAFTVHEDLQTHHKPPTQSKFLEVPFYASEPDFVVSLTDVVARAIVEASR